MVKYLFKTFVSDLQQKKQEMSKLAYSLGIGLGLK